MSLRLRPLSWMMTRTVEVLDPYVDGKPCPVCGAPRWVVVGEQGKFPASLHEWRLHWTP